MRRKLLDLFSGQGGASAGYARAGFDVTGVDLSPQPRYPYEFHQGDALKFLLEHHKEFDVIHASPPCQAHTNAQKIQGNDHPDFIEATKELLDLINDRRQAYNQRPLYWILENVPGAPLREDLTLCGSMFEIETYRHRIFEVYGFDVVQPQHPVHEARTAKMGRPARDGEFMHIVGNFSGVEKARQIMDMPWANRDGLREAIPPIYAEYIGQQLMNHISATPPSWRFSYAQGETR